jgi:phage terminase large subunit-like protein
LKRLTYGNEAIEWIERYCTLPSGDHIGEPFVLMEWQKEWLRELYRTDPEGNLQYRWALLGVPKGNGKTPLVAALALYHMLGDPDEPDPYIVMAAASDKQANECFGAARDMCSANPELAAATTRFRWEIQAAKGRGKIERVAASRGKLDGKRVSMLVMDELHEWIEENWVVLTGGALKRRRTQIIQTTTAGWDRESLCYREYLKGDALRAAANPTYFVSWHQAPENADYTDPKVWKNANPAWDVIVDEDTLREVFNNQTESQFRRYRLNQWVESEDFWLPFGAWDRCKGNAELIPRHPTWVGWDASTKNDSTAIVAVQNQDGIAVVRSWVWSRPVRPDGNPDDNWLLPIVECENLIRSLCTEYDVQEVSYDPAWITWSAADLEAEGWPMVEFPQTPSRMCPATAGLYTAVIQGNLRHDGDPVLAAHIKSARVRPMRMGGEMLEKSHKGRKIDAAVALCMAIHGAVGAAEDNSTQVIWA